MKLKDILNEKITIDVEIGDTILTGRFKNKKVVVKTISWNEKGDLLINGRSSMRMRIWWIFSFGWFFFCAFGND